MQTTSINVVTHCLPCHCRCRYCLLSWDGKTVGADYERSAAYARRFYDWLRENRRELSFAFYFGYCMEHPQLPEAVDFLRSIGSPGGRFLQLNGMVFRSEAQLPPFLTQLKSHGIELIDLTFYGLREYHDRFAGRKGDFDYLLSILRSAAEVGLPVHVSLPLSRENAGQAAELLALLNEYPTESRSAFIPHAEGRGRSLDSVRFSQADYDALSGEVKALINTRRFKSECDWLSMGEFSTPQKRVLTLSLTPENIEKFEVMPFADAIAYLEALDDNYHRAMPSMAELAALYGDPSSEKWYSQRDLLLRWQRQYTADNGLELYDINDERGHFSRRI